MFIKDEGIVLTGRAVEFENGGVLNPACIEVDGVVHMFYRAVDGGHFSSIGYCQLIDNKIIHRLDNPVLHPEHAYERHGVEDPRITKIDGLYYLLYTVYDGRNALFAYATSKDLLHFKKHGIISPQLTYGVVGHILENMAGLDSRYHYFEAHVKKVAGKDVMLWEKDAVLFPRKFNGKFALLHRILPGIQICFFEEFTDLTTSFWENHIQNLQEHILMEPKYPHENAYIGGGCPPIETEKGWLIIYHSVEEMERTRIYHASAALLDLHDPRRVIGRLKEPLFSPSTEWEKVGVVGNVVFPTGAIVQNDKLTVYYGAADRVIGAKSMSLSGLIQALMENRE